jgi:hypothetical protein
MKAKSSVKIVVEFGAYSHCLWEGRMACYLNNPEFKGRFVLLEGKRVAKDKGSQYTCATYLEAKVWQAVLKTQGHASSLYSDEHVEQYQGGGGRWVVVAPTVKFDLE